MINLILPSSLGIINIRIAIPLQLSLDSFFKVFCYLLEFPIIKIFWFFISFYFVLKISLYFTNFTFQTDEVIKDVSKIKSDCYLYVEIV